MSAVARLANRSRSVLASPARLRCAPLPRAASPARGWPSTLHRATAAPKGKARQSRANQVARNWVMLWLRCPASALTGIPASTRVTVPVPFSECIAHVCWAAWLPGWPRHLTAAERRECQAGPGRGLYRACRVVDVDDHLTGCTGGALCLEGCWQVGQPEDRRDRRAQPLVGDQRGQFA